VTPINEGNVVLAVLLQADSKASVTKDRKGFMSLQGRKKK
jgi:hypothetical protein